jgi:hypothetical protein
MQVAAEWRLTPEKLESMPQGATTVDVYKKQVDKYLEWLGVDVGNRPLKTLWERFEYLVGLIGLSGTDKQAAGTTLDVLINKRQFFSAVRYVIKLCWDIKRLNAASSSNIRRMASKTPVPDEDAEEDIEIEMPKVWLQKGGILDPFLHNHDEVEILTWDDWAARAFEVKVRSQTAALVGCWRARRAESEALPTCVA